MSALVWVGVVLAVLWAVLWIGFKVVGGLIHLLILAAVIFIIWGLVRRGAQAISSKM
jgi:hypothetical protein